MRRLLLLAVLSLGFSSLWSQDLDSQTDSATLFDVYLKDGTVLKSAILKSNPQNLLVIQLSDGQLMTIFQGEIMKLQQPKWTKRQSYFNKIDRRGYYNITEMALMFGRNTYGYTVIGLSVYNISGHRFKDYFQLGLGVGIDLYQGYRTVPIFASLRGDILRSKVMPYYYASFGYSPAWALPGTFEEISGGINYSFGVGLKFPANKKAWLLGIGHKAQNLHTRSGDFENLGWEEEENRHLRRLAISFGVTF